MATEESKEQRAARKAYIAAGRHLRLQRHDLAQEVVHRNWVAAGAGACTVATTTGAVLTWLLSEWFTALIIAPGAALVIIMVCLDGIHDDVRKARKQVLRAEMECEDAAAEYLGIDPPLPSL